MKSIYSFLASIFKSLSEFFVRLEDKPRSLPEPVVPEIEVSTAMTSLGSFETIEKQRDIGDANRKMLLLLAKDALTDSEKRELNDLTAGREIIILEDT